MKKRLFSIAVIFAVLVTIIYSCKKTGIEESAQPATPQEIASIKSWLFNQQETSSNPEWVNEMISSIFWDKSERTSFHGDQILITIPVKVEMGNALTSRYLTRANSATKNILSVILDKEMIVQQGSINQITPSEQISQKYISDLVKNIYCKNNIQFSGSFTQYTVHNNFIYELQFKKNMLSGEFSLKQMPNTTFNKKMVDSKKIDPVSFKFLSSKAGQNPGTFVSREEGQYATNNDKRVNTDGDDCIYMFLIHWEYDGIEFTVTSVIYLGSICGLCDANSIRPNEPIQKVKVNCGGGGGGGPATVYTNVINYKKTWAVAVVNDIGIYKTNTFSIDRELNLITNVTFQQLGISNGAPTNVTIRDTASYAEVWNTWNPVPCSVTHCTALVKYDFDDAPTSYPGSKFWSLNDIKGN